MLVIFSCLRSVGCSETSTHYYNTNPELKEMVKLNETRINKLAGPFVVQVVGPMIYTVMGGTGTLD
jgi:hypothetical protein